MRYHFFIIIAMIALKILLADAIISTDKTTYDYGTVTEGEQEKIVYRIPIKNTGNDPLRIQKIRKSCGCTSITYDTLIMPGKTTTIQTEINIHGLSGKLKKNITIISNAANDKNYKINLEFFVQKIINTSEEYINLNQKDHELFLSTKKKNFKVSKVYFEEIYRTYRQKNKEPKKIDIDFKQVNLNTKGILCTYKLNLLSKGNVSNPLEGYFIFETNHPQQPLLKIRGTLSVE